MDVLHVVTRVAFFGAAAVLGFTEQALGRPGDILPASSVIEAKLAASSVALTEDGHVYLVGGFSQVNGQPFPGLVRLLPDGSIDPGFQPAIGMPGDFHPEIRVIQGNRLLLQLGGADAVLSTYCICCTGLLYLRAALIAWPCRATDF